MNTSSPEIVVSICCITYNHERYIAQALESFLMQKTNFKFEIIIGDDASTDDTNKIIADYCTSYPGLITLITHQTNIGAVGNQLAVMYRAKGKYIAMCDGDDFWTDPLKLQKQADFLASHPAYVICCHHTKVIDEQGQTVYLKNTPVKMEFDYRDLLLGRREETRICSLMVRNIDRVREVGKQQWYKDTYGTDTFFKLYVLASTRKKIYVMPEVMACYRLHAGGIWSMIDSRRRKRQMVSDFKLMISNFNYSARMKHQLLKIYLGQYFLFELREYNFKNAFFTIYSLL